ncbi:hypothetical protein AFERRID_07500 [Acidithiobacillus ferridurans]|uniref:Uncharacterized protein n=2 Tax=Acidithiobacillaceae TaxID=225058 RepID=A0A2Z6IG26_ACIFI|nr:hypothetical protein AFERRID_07500 [Acidithiobacillus ferridurans]
MVNFPNSGWRMDAYISRIQISFDDQVIVVEAEEAGNKILVCIQRQQFFTVSQENNGESERSMNSLYDVSIKNTAHKLIYKLIQLYAL